MPVTKVTRSSAGISLLTSDLGGLRGLIIAATPRATPILKRLEPSALPTASSGLSFSAETAEEKISGADVPKATIVRPIINGETPKCRARTDAPNTNLSAPQIRPINPRTMMAVSRSIYEVFLMPRRSGQLEDSLESFASNNLLNCLFHVNCPSAL